ncbi:MAG: hypothetical protein EBR82_52110 [Caulobacteraceae bacterium]|nr:hypothetical protein [Caulobacteraceae bacterium]
MNCPFCKADANRYVPKFARARFCCGTVLWDGREAASTDRTIACFRAEVDALKDRISALESSARALLAVLDGDAEDITEAVDALRGAVEAKQ